ncbi:hypothetical protein K470DRAFT_271506 [Piedraia hortae CBS 480.64]|uniref:Uncharacterized protein n=1 Tax=Piedraia hortae CBS 480.64 TaxID=1314780 RepID=A0A6A7BWG8_9PEZI|nr:hypothetical protein K470DRAFT_271506 [Piedraia hortae CBS 480.64]
MAHNRAWLMEARLTQLRAASVQNPLTSGTVPKEKLQRSIQKWRPCKRSLQVFASTQPSRSGEQPNAPKQPRNRNTNNKNSAPSSIHLTHKPQNKATAIANLENALLTQSQSLNQTNLTILSTLDQLCTIYRNVPAVVRAYKFILPIAERQLGPVNPSTLKIITLLGRAYELSSTNLSPAHQSFTRAF